MSEKNLNPAHVNVEAFLAAKDAGREAFRADKDWHDITTEMLEAYARSSTALPAQPGTVTSTEVRDGAWWIKHANVVDHEDCEACVEYEHDLCPVHHGMAIGQMLFSRAIGAICADNELLAYIPAERIPYPVDDSQARNINQG